MAEQSTNKEVSQYITVNSLKDIADPAKKFLKRGKKRELKLRAKVNDYSNGAGRLADSTGLINFTTEGVNVNAGQTYELTGLLKVQNYKLVFTVLSASASSEAITSTGAENFSSNEIDQHSAKNITTIANLLKNRIGQSFFAKVHNITPDQKRVKATLADNTGAIDVEISANKKQITDDVINNLSSDKVYLFSDMVINFSEQNKLVGRFNYRSAIQEVNDRKIPSVSNNNLSTKEYTSEEQQGLKEVLQIHERKQREPRQNNNRQRRNNNRGNEKRAPKRNIESSSPVLISDLQQWNNNQSFVGKILSLNVEKKTLNSSTDSEPKVKSYLKGTVGDHTGVIDFDMAEKNGEPRFSVGDVVSFNMAMNKGRTSQQNEQKVGGHYIEIKKFGSYTILKDKSIEKVNQGNNMSAKELTPRPNKNAVTGEITKIEEQTNKIGKINYVGLIKGENGQETHFKTQKRDEWKVGQTVTVTNNRYRNNNDNQNRRRNNNQHRQNNQRNRSNSPNQNRGNNRNRMNNQRGNNNRSGNNQNYQNNSNNSNNQNNRTNQGGYQKRPYNQGQRQQGDRQNNNQNNNYQNRNNQDRYNNQDRNNQNRNKKYSDDQQGGNRRQFNNQRQPRNNDVTISNLRPGERGQYIVGQVFQVEKFSKVINDKTFHFVKGRIGDDTGNINFDVKQPRNLELQQGKVYQFQLINNKVSDSGYHYIDLLRFGRIYENSKTFTKVNTSNDNESNRSQIEYVKKQIPNDN